MFSVLKINRYKKLNECVLNKIKKCYVVLRFRLRFI